MSELQRQFGNIDIYLFDQLLRGRITPGMRIFDAGFGGARNIVYFLNEGYDVSGADASDAAVDELRRHVAETRPDLPAENFRAELLQSMSFAPQSADVVICNAVLHFARDDAELRAMLDGAWRILSPGGLFFCRLASSIGIESRVARISGRRHQLPDGSTRYLVDEPQLLGLTAALGATLLDPLKTTVVQNQRAMTTWVCRKN